MHFMYYYSILFIKTQIPEVSITTFVIVKNIVYVKSYNKLFNYQSFNRFVKTDWIFGFLALEYL